MEEVTNVSNEDFDFAILTNAFGGTFAFLPTHKT
jgi:hypothetical protein